MGSDSSQARARRPAPGRLLVAAVDPQAAIRPQAERGSAAAEPDGFEGSVVVLVDADRSGALGVIVNQVSALSLAAVLPAWPERVNEPRVLFRGGPVSPDGAICLARPRDRGEEPPGWRRVWGDVGLLHLDTPVELVDGAYRDLRIFAGYAGWGPGQLERELAAGFWHVVDSRPEDLFASDPAHLWRRVLRRQPLATAIWSTWPDDPGLN